VVSHDTGADEALARETSGQELNYDTGGFWKNMVTKYPGWRAREGFSQPALGVPGEPDDPLKGG
jgi:hypothetical protein